MTEISAILGRINDKKLNQPTDYRKWVEASDRISVHAKGIRPQFESQRKNSRKVVTPANYEKRYQYLFDDYILNRHPNEQWEHYQFRLSTFPILAQEIYLNAKSQIIGSIFQTSQYTLKANDEDDNEYLKEIKLEDRLKGDIAEHIFTDPYGKIAIVEKHFEEFNSTDPTLPDIELMESRYIREYEPGEYILFQAQNLYRGKIIMYYMDRRVCYKIIEGENKDTFSLLSWYEHGFDELPVINNDIFIFQPFVSWADMLARNVSDDEILAKNNSYPHKEVILPKCGVCLGQKTESVACTPCEAFPQGVMDRPCSGCGGRGTISINPGDTFTTPEHEYNDLRPQIDRVKYYNPDITTNEFSFKRWQHIYDFGMRSMHMKFVEEAQSGVAKAYDRQLLYFLISNVSNKLFEIAEQIIRFTLAYRNLAIDNGDQVHEFVEYTVERPQQFQIKNEYDIQQEYVELLEKGGDLFIRREKQNELVQKTFYGNNYALKKHRILTLFDMLYGMTDEEVNNRKLWGTATPEVLTKHDMADYLLNHLAMEKGEAWVIEQNEKTIIDRLNADVKAFIPQEAIVIEDGM